MRKFIIFTYAMASFSLIFGIISIHQGEGLFTLSVGKVFALGFSVLVALSGILMAYYVYIDGKILTTLQSEVKPENKQQPKDPGNRNSVAFTMAHVKVDQLNRLQLGELKSRSSNTKKHMVKEIASEARALCEHEYLETTSAEDVSIEIMDDLTKELGTDFEVLQGSGSGRGSVVYVRRTDLSPQT